MTNIAAEFTHKGIALVRTCYACPEQYDAYDGTGRRVGYFRLRHGWFTVEKYAPGGDLVFDAEPYGDGIFESDERERYLIAGIEALKAAL